MSFTAEIGHYAGSTSSYTTPIAQWLTDAVKVVVVRIGALAPDMLEQFATTAAITDGNGVNLAAKGKILMVERDASDSGSSNDDLRTAKPVKLQFKNQISSTTSMYYAPKEDPKYYIEAGTLYIKPTPSSNEAGVVHHVAYGALNDTNETIAFFPDEFKKHVVLWVAMNVLHAKMVDMIALLPTDLDGDLTTFDAIADFSATMASTIGLPGAFSVSTGLPDLQAMPSISGEVADAMTNAKHFLDNAGGEAGLTTDVEDWLNNEDVEMVESVLQTIATELQRANAHLAQHQAEQQKQMNAWRQEVEQYQAELQEEGAMRGHDMSKYQAEVSRESVRIQGELAEYQANVAKKYQAFNTRIQKEIQKYQWYQGQLAYVQQMYEQCWAPYQGAMTDQNTSYARARK